MRRRVDSASLCLLVALSGCAMPPPMQPATLSISAAYPGASPSESHATAADIGWRTMFGDTRLQRLIEMALENNRDLKLAALNVDQVRAQYDLQGAALFPRVEANLNASRSRANAPASTAVQKQIGASITASYELDLFGRLHAATDAALARYLASDEGRHAVKIALVAAVADAYYAGCLAEAQAALAGRTADDARTSLTLLRRLRSARQTGGIEIAQAEAQLASSEADLEARRREVLLRRHALKQLLGSTASPDFLPDRSAEGSEGLALAAASLVTRLPAGLPSDLLLRRPDLREKELALAAAQADVTAARAALFPRISLTASTGLASAGLQSLFKTGSGVWAFAPQITQPLFNGGQLRAELRLAELRQSTALLEYEKAVEIAFREVADGLAGSKSFGDQIDAQKRAEQAAERRAALSEKRYLAGVESRLDHLEAQRHLHASRQALLDMRRAEIGNAIALYKSLGGGLLETDLAN
ncbi:efflux transporter outer membrane subunit [Paucibacter sp. PLA-PC-4]|uniref:efflux transporter outer membrane subunit n=1 Tax=Paucibacter sp. PLA-PC-4 TaxID=2993655 RepID=UPI00224AC2C6|nr:efflux transporter outer membrane subunit [Paucibacter sp. PLA-PC-4]MCX2865711.1 efflux transporter outer membrane subunit [Paucibacter sp. PLA-PC-4]